MISIRNIDGLKIISKVLSGNAIEKNISYGERDDMKLDIYGKKTKQLLPVIMFWHGGGWTDGNKDQYGFVANYLQTLEAIVVIVGHPLYPKQTFPGFIGDGKKASQWVSNNISKFGGDPEKIYAMGHSSGAHIASIVTLEDKDIIRGCITFALPCTIYKKYWDKVFGKEFDNDSQNPINHIKKGNQSFLLIHGASDKIVNKKDSLGMNGALIKAGHHSDLIIIPNLGHMRIIETIVKPFAYRYNVGQKISNFVHQDK